MKTALEIIETWGMDGAYRDWYALDELKDDGTMLRIAVEAEIGAAQLSLQEVLVLVGLASERVNTARVSDGHLARCDIALNSVDAVGVSHGFFLSSSLSMAPL